jgi:NTE family protein
LRQAVLASCAVPGLYSAVRISRRTLVDGGFHSTTNLDLATRSNSPVVIALAPMGFDPSAPIGPARSLLRARFNMELARDKAIVRARGAEVLLLRPTGAELELHGHNILRSTGNDAVVEAAYQATAGTLRPTYAQSVLGPIRASTRPASGKFR